MSTPVDAKKINPVDELIPAIYAAIEEWNTANSKEFIGKKVKDLLDSQSKQVVMKLLGFNERYGQAFALDHCNGRAGNSPAGDYLKGVQQEVVHAWLSQVKMPELTKTELATIAKDFKYEHQRALLSRLKNMAQAKADADANILLTSLTSSCEIGNFIKAMELISQTPTEQ